MTTIHNVITKIVQLALGSETVLDLIPALPQRQFSELTQALSHKWRHSQLSATSALIFLHICSPVHELRKFPVISIPTEEVWAAQSVFWSPFGGAQVLMICMLRIPCPLYSPRTLPHCHPSYFKHVCILGIFTAMLFGILITLECISRDHALLSAWVKWVLNINKTSYPILRTPTNMGRSYRFWITSVAFVDS